MTTTIVHAQKNEKLVTKHERSHSIFIKLVEGIDLYQQMYEDSVLFNEDSLQNQKYLIVEYLDTISGLSKNLVEKTKLTDQEVVEGNNNTLQLIENIRKNLTGLITSNEELLVPIRAAQYPDSIRNIVEEFISNNNSVEVGATMLHSLKKREGEVYKLLKKPISIEAIAEWFKMEPVHIKKLLINTGYLTNKKENDVVVKGYSPFSNVYKEFVFFADSLKNQDSTKTIGKANSDSIKVVRNELDNEQEEAKVASVKEDSLQDLELGSLYQLALQDSLFPHELISRYDKESLKKYWTIYRNQWSDPLVRKNTDITISQDDVGANLLIATNNSNVTNETSNTEKASSTIVLERVDQTDESSQQQSPVSIVVPSNTGSGEVVYFVQIAASRTPISNTLLSSLYGGSRSINVRQEDGWYKYQLGGTQDYLEAKGIEKEAKVPGVFVVAYRNDAKQILWKTKSWQNRNRSGELEFLVQISANQKQMNPEQKIQLEKKYNGVVREIVEDGWYKYQLVVGESYAEAIKKWKQVGVSVSFVVSYFQGKKIKLSEAIKMYNENKTK